MNEKHLFISIRDNNEAYKLDKEITKYTKEAELDVSTFAPAYEANQTIKQSMLQSAINSDGEE